MRLAGYYAVSNGATAQRRTGPLALHGSAADGVSESRHTRSCPCSEEKARERCGRLPLIAGAQHILSQSTATLDEQVPGTAL